MRPWGKAFVYWRVLSSVSEGPFGYSLLRQSSGEGAHSNRTWLLGGGGAAAALQTYSPAGGGYLSHLVHSSGWPIPSTTTSITHGEGHIWPYLSMCAAVYQHTPVEPQKTTFLRRVSEKKSQNGQHTLKCAQPWPGLKLDITGWGSVHWSPDVCVDSDHSEWKLRVGLEFFFSYFEFNSRRNSYTFAALNKVKVSADYYTEMNGWLYLCTHL